MRACATTGMAGEDASGYWGPARNLAKGNTTPAVTPAFMKVYYRQPMGVPAASVRTPPANLHVIAGDSSATSESSTITIRSSTWWDWLTRCTGAST